MVLFPAGEWIMKNLMSRYQTHASRSSMTTGRDSESTAPELPQPTEGHAEFNSGVHSEKAGEEIGLQLSKDSTVTGESETRPLKLVSGTL